jgi:hypothetical protein
VLVDFAVVMLTAVLLSVPSQSPGTLGAELLTLGLAFGVLLELLERRAKNVDPLPLARLLKRVNANVVVAGGLVATGALLLAGIDWAMFVVVPTTCFALISGLTSAWLLLTRLPDRAGCTVVPGATEVQPTDRSEWAAEGDPVRTVHTSSLIAATRRTCAPAQGVRVVQ